MSRKDFVVAVVIIIASLGLVMHLAVPTTHTRIVSDATLSAYGEFDRIELSNRYIDWLSGVEVEGAQLASLNGNGTVSIENRHRTGTTFLFILRIYADENHITEKISVVGGDVSEYEYPNLIITVSLTTAEESYEYSSPMFAALMGFVFAAILVGVYYMHKTW